MLVHLNRSIQIRHAKNKNLLAFLDDIYEDLKPWCLKLRLEAGSYTMRCIAPLLTESRFSSLNYCGVPLPFLHGTVAIYPVPRRVDASRPGHCSAVRDDSGVHVGWQTRQTQPDQGHRLRMRHAPDRKSVV